MYFEVSTKAIKFIFRGHYMMKQPMSQEQIINLLLDKKIQLYSRKDIQEILNISKSTLDRWIRNGKPEDFSIGLLQKSRIERTSLFTQRRSTYFDRNDIDNTDEDDEMIVFPSPDLYIGRSPRWIKQTIATWLIEFNKNKM